MVFWVGIIYRVSKRVYLVEAVIALYIYIWAGHAGRWSDLPHECTVWIGRQQSLPPWDRRSRFQPVGLVVVPILDRPRCYIIVVGTSWIGWRGVVNGKIPKQGLVPHLFGQ